MKAGLKEEHPFLGESNHRLLVVDLVKNFLKKNFNLNIDSIQSKVGHLFFGKRAFPLAGRDIGFVYDGKAKYYPVDEESSIDCGIMILIDEVGSRFDIGISEISKDDLGFYFENILINIKIIKDSWDDISCFDSDNLFFEIYSINNYGVLVKKDLHKIEEIEKLSSDKILNIIFFNLEKFS